MTNTKSILEVRNECYDNALEILNTAENEGRALTTEELAQVQDYRAQVEAYDATIEEARKVKMMKVVNTENGTVAIDVEAAEKQAADIKAMNDYIRFKKDVLDTATQMKQSGNTAVIPTTIADKIIEKVKEISPIYNLATKYTEPGELKLTVLDTSSDDVTIDFVDDELDVPDSHVPGFTTITLGGAVYRALALISKKLIRNAAFDLVTWLVGYLSRKIAAFFERVLIGSADVNAKVKGILGSYDSTNMKIVTADKSKVTFDEIVDLTDKVVDTYQQNAVFIMSRETRKEIRKLKDGDGRYLLLVDPTMPYGYSLLGKPVYLTENLGNPGTASANLIIYGDISGLAVKEPGSFEIEVLYERYSDAGAVGINLWGEIDSKVEDKQKIAVMVAKAS